MKTLRRSAFIVAAMALSGTAFAQQHNLHVSNSFPIKSNGGWDYLTVDAPGKRIFVSHGTQVNVISTTGDSLGVISNTAGVHGIALVPALNKGYTSNGKANACTVFDMQTYQTLGTIPVGTNPDAIFYDAYSKKVFVFNGKSQDATVIDPATDKIVATIPLGGKPETGVSNGKGLVFVNSETTNEVVVIDANALKVVKRFKLTGGDEPSGLAIDVATNRLFAGCGGNATMIILDATTGKNLAKFKIGDCDGVAFDPELKQAYSSNHEGTLSVIKEVSANKFVQLADVKTEPGARTIALDASTHKIYLPTAKTESVPAGSTERPKMIPGTFHVLEISK
ncbi:YncE family protein [Mucilaginibacter conchicola]|uniref:YncE family protein n=1 Tax=Mucilaginibacter conchicola TaxID=2303333 RepID=A0A372NZM8_9SPHI|nr:YncE family protein [Mucilaginibacter conchicola]RFZ95588.1 YncE family protein [Mucilaginibacter conchicola]